MIDDEVTGAIIEAINGLLANSAQVQAKTVEELLATKERIVKLEEDNALLHARIDALSVAVDQGHSRLSEKIGSSELHNCHFCKRVYISGSYVRMGPNMSDDRWKCTDCDKDSKAKVKRGILE